MIGEPLPPIRARPIFRPRCFWTTGPTSPPIRAGKTGFARYSRRPLVVWGKYNPSFTVAGATAYAGDVPKAEIHMLEAEHFALDEATDEIASLVRDFLERLALNKEHG
jgi:pimeloyl-ACP methyl ester carboxylesterase